MTGRTRSILTLSAISAAGLAARLPPDYISRRKTLTDHPVQPCHAAPKDTRREIQQVMREVIAETGGQDSRVMPLWRGVLNGLLGGLWGWPISYVIFNHQANK